ncbi:MAG: hypothetical protein J7493_10375 [Porphyrobacter sp.]|nr:hypothetical protein [Porphyrobacter sp.]
MAGSGESWTYRAGVGVAIVVSLLIVWTTIVRDDGTGMSYFMLIMAAGVGAFAARASSAGMARTMLGVGVMQALLGIAIATAPMTARVPDGPFKALLFNGVFTAFWLIAAALFRAASRKDYETASA